MNTEQFLFKAKQGRLIQWLRSGKIEYIFMNKKGQVLAKDFNNQIHFIYTKDKKNWDCRLVKESELVQLKNLI